MGLVEPEPFLISDTVVNNILLGRERKEAKLKEVLCYACLEKDVETLAQGLETEVGERGANLSGG